MCLCRHGTTSFASQILEKHWPWPVVDAEEVTNEIINKSYGAKKSEAADNHITKKDSEEKQNNSNKDLGSA